MATSAMLKKNIILAIAALSIFQLPAPATTLSGHLEEQHQIPQETQSGSAAIGPGASELSPNTFPKTYLGTWSTETTVVDSTAPQVMAGQVINSDVVFYPTSDGRVQARWNQPGWVDTQTTASTYGASNEAKSDRTSYYFGENSQGSWAARARDQFKQTGKDEITAKSYIDQYVDGQYVGRYRTISVLKRTSTDTSIASR